MAGVMSRYGMYGVHLNSTLLGGVTQVDEAYENTVQDDALSGEGFARWLSLVAQKGRASFSTKQLKTLLDTVAMTADGLPWKFSSIAATVWANGLRFYWQKFAAGGSRASGSVHIQDKVFAGICAVQRISCEHQGDAVAQCDVVPAFDGSNDLIARTYNVALPGGLTDDQRFTLGKTTLGGVLFDHLRSVEVGLGFSIDLEGSDSEITERFAFVNRMQPTIMIRGLDPGWYEAAKIATNGLICTHANTKLYFRKRAAGSTFVADGTAEHISITANGLLTLQQIGSGAPGAASETVGLLKCKFDGSLSPLVFDTATTIT